MARPGPTDEAGDADPHEWQRIAWWRSVLWLMVPVLVLSFTSGLLYLVFFLSEPGEAQTTLYWFYFFDVGREINVPTWFSAGLWIVAAVLAGYFARHAPRNRRSWVLFAVVCAMASLDETLELHERLDVLGNAIAEHLPVHLGFTWVIPGAVIALAVVALLIRLVLNLPRGPRLGLLLAGAVFMIGAVGVESLSGLYIGRETLPWQFFLLTLIEETLEMTGEALAVASLLHLVAHRSAGGGATEYLVAVDLP